MGGMINDRIFLGNLWIFHTQPRAAMEFSSHRQLQGSLPYFQCQWWWEWAIGEECEQFPCAKMTFTHLSASSSSNISLKQDFQSKLSLISGVKIQTIRDGTRKREREKGREVVKNSNFFTVRCSTEKRWWSFESQEITVNAKTFACFRWEDEDGRNCGMSCEEWTLRDGNFFEIVLGSGKL